MGFLSMAWWGDYGRSLEAVKGESDRWLGYRLEVAAT
jgi:hypothetical protein